MKGEGERKGERGREGGGRIYMYLLHILYLRDKDM